MLRLSVILQSLSWLSVTPWRAACQASLSFTISRSSRKLTSTELVMLSDSLILCHPFSFCLQSFLFLRIGWFGLCTFQGILKNLLQHHSSKASILWHSAFFMIKLLNLYMTVRKDIALTIWTYISKVMSLLINMLCSFIIAFPPRRKHLLISWLQSLSAVFSWIPWK